MIWLRNQVCPVPFVKRRGLLNPPLATPVDPARLYFSDADLGLVIIKAAGEAAAGPDRDGADGG